MRFKKDEGNLLDILNALHRLSKNNPELSWKILRMLEQRECAKGGHGPCDKFNDFDVVVIVSKNDHRKAENFRKLRLR